jgi:hypothetical protein
LQRLLCGAVAAGLVAVGAGAIVAPRPSAWMFGLATGDPNALAFVHVFHLGGFAAVAALALSLPDE